MSNQKLSYLKIQLYNQKNFNQWKLPVVSRLEPSPLVKEHAICEFLVKIFDSLCDFDER